VSQNISFLQSGLRSGCSWHIDSAQLLFSHVMDSFGNGDKGRCFWVFCRPGVQCRSYPDDQHVQKLDCTVRFYFHGNLDGRS